MRESYINPVAASMDEYITKAISRDAARNPTIANLSLGEPWFGPPPLMTSIISELSESGGISECLRTYGPAYGSDALRQSIAARYERLYGMKIDPMAELVITAGGAAAFSTVVLAVTEPGDEVLIFEPAYMLYERSCRLLGRVPVRVGRQPLDGFRIHPWAVREKITGRTRLVVLNSPENPTGYVADADTLKSLSALCAECGITLLHDEVYDDFVFGPGHVPARLVAEAPGHVVMINSFSKRYGLLGLRLGWIAAGPRIASAAAKVHEYMALSVNGIAERTGTILLDSPRMDRWILERRHDLLRRRNLLLGSLGAVPGIRVPNGLPAGGMFVLADVSTLAASVSPSDWRAGIPAGRIVARHFINELGIAVVPADVYGSNCKDCIRLVFAVRSQTLDLAIRSLSLLTGNR